MIELSVCIIAKNEENMIADCLESVKQIAAEIILVDTGSTDSTIEIANKFHCKIYKYPWQNDFSAARNFALGNASYPYILSIDADERLLNPKEVVDAIESSGDNIGGWLIEIISVAPRKDGGEDSFVNSLIRLFRNHPDIRFSGIIHEQVVESILKAGYKLNNTEIKFKHLGYSHDTGKTNQKQLRNLELLTTALKNEPNDAYTLYQRANTYLALKMLTEAEKDISEALKYVSDGSSVLPQALNFGAIIAYQTGNFDTAISRADRSLAIVPVQQFANFVKGESYLSQNKFNEALTAFEKMEKAGNNQDWLAKIIGDYKLPPEQLSFRRGRCYLGLKQFHRAKEQFEKGYKINPREIGNIVGKANIFYQYEQYDETMKLLNEALGHEPENPIIHGYIKQTQAAIDKVKFKDRQQGNSNIKNLPDENHIENPLISLSMIVKNEEKMLAGCLESVRGIADEIVIVDTGSSDATIKIAEKFGAKIFEFPWKDNFAAARNESLKQCTGKWIIYLDADERLDIESTKNLRQILSSLDEGIGAIICTLESEHLQLDGSAELHRGGYPRIFRNYGFPKIQFRGRVHEQITPSIFELGKSIEFSDVIIRHLGYNVTREEMERKVKRNYKMLMQHINEEPLNGYAWFQLGQTLCQMRLFKEGEQAIRFAIQTSQLSESIYASATATLSQLTGNQKKFEEALYWAEQSLSIAPKQVYALNLKAYSLLYLDKAKEAEPLFLEVIRRLKESKDVPRTGFDVIVPMNLVEYGLNEARKKTGSTS